MPTIVYQVSYYTTIDFDYAEVTEQVTDNLGQALGAARKIAKGSSRFGEKNNSCYVKVWSSGKWISKIRVTADNAEINGVDDFS
jgi:hypothetical protein